MKGLIPLFILIFLLAGCGKQSTIVNVNLDNGPAVVEQEQIEENIVTPPKPVEPQQIEIPAKLDLGAPFVSQAPLRNWDPPYNEACEEASMLSVVKHLNQGATDSETINKEILALIDWEERNGYKIDLTAEETKEVLKKYFNIESYLTTEVTVDRIKYELSQGNLIIVPLAGRNLGNPYFRSPGPIYHMIVIRGYDNRNFITNEVGTNTKGEAFKYRYNIVIDAVHDWNHELAEDEMTEEEIEQGRKVMIVINN